MRAKRTDAVQAECIRAIRMLGLKYKDLSQAGNGIEDLVVLLPKQMAEVFEEIGKDLGWPLEVQMPAYWLFVECKTIERESTGYIRYKKAQKEWRAATPNGPRITVTGFEDTLTKLRARMEG